MAVCSGLSATEMEALLSSAPQSTMLASAVNTVIISNYAKPAAMAGNIMKAMQDDALTFQKSESAL